MVEIVPGRTIAGRVEGVYAALGEGFETEAREALDLDYDGIAGDKHGGLVRESGAREPWYPRGTLMRNERQLSLLSVDDLVDIADGLGIAEVRPEWIGGNVLLSGIPLLSLLPPRSIMMFEGGVSIRIDGDNGPCRSSGRAIVRHVPERKDIEFGFVKAGQHRRGLVGWVERAGTIRVGETVNVRIWPQWIYPVGAGG